MWSSASANELRMSLPTTAVGPLKVETKPILMVSPADAGFASTSAAAPASQNAVFITTPLLIIGPGNGVIAAFGSVSIERKICRAANGSAPALHHISPQMEMARNIILLTLPEPAALFAVNVDTPRLFH